MILSDFQDMILLIFSIAFPAVIAIIMALSGIGCNVPPKE